MYLTTIYLLYYMYIYMYRLWSFMSRYDHCHQYHPEWTSGTSGCLCLFLEKFWIRSWFWLFMEYKHCSFHLWMTNKSPTIHNQHVGIQNMKYNIKTTRVLPLWEEYFWTFDMRQSVWTQVWLEVSGQEKQDDISFVSLNQQLLLFNKIIISSKLLYTRNNIYKINQ